MSKGEILLVLSAEMKLIKLRKGTFSYYIVDLHKDMISLLVSSVVSNLDGSTIKGWPPCVLRSCIFLLFNVFADQQTTTLLKIVYRKHCARNLSSYFSARSDFDLKSITEHVIFIRNFTSNKKLLLTNPSKRIAEYTIVQRNQAQSTIHTPIGGNTKNLVISRPPTSSLLS